MYCCHQFIRNLPKRQWLLGYIQKLFLKYNGVRPKHICFEITETAAIRNLTAATAFIRALKRIGCRFALDDFGSGLSSFAYLKNLPIDFLKIDGAFVRDMEQDPFDCAIVEATVRIASVMKVPAIAEWVENEEILKHLRKLGVSYGQGYYISKPKIIGMTNIKT